MFLVETTVLSEVQRPRPDEGVVRWFDSTPAALQFTSVMVFGELVKGASRMVEGPRQGRLLEFVRLQVVAAFGDRILPVSLEVAELWGELNGDALRRGESLPAIDSLIAATALVHRLTVVTRNVRDFERCGATVLSPWEAAR